MAVDKSASWMYAEQYVDEPPELAEARQRAAGLGCPAVGPGVGAVLRLLAASLPVNAAVEIGTGGGVAASWLLEGMPEGAIVTTIDVEAEFQRLARHVLASQGFPTARARIINGRPSEVLPRLADGAYDLVLAYAPMPGAGRHIEQALRLLRTGGVLAVDSALWRDKVPDPTRRDEVTTQVREISRRMRDDERVTPLLLSVGDGLLLAVKN